MKDNGMVNWYINVGKLRASLFITAIMGKIILYMIYPPSFMSSRVLIQPFAVLLILEILWSLFTAIILIECIRIVANRFTSTWTNRKHFMVTGFFIFTLMIFMVLINFPKTSMRYYNHAWSLAEKKEYEQALTGLGIAINFDSKNMMAYLERGYIHRERGELVSALNDYSRAIDIKPNYADAYAGRGYVYHYLGD